MGTFPSLTEGESVSECNSVGLPGVGIDRLSLSFPVYGWADDEHWDKITYGVRDGRMTMQGQVAPYVGGPAVMVGVTTVEGEPWGKVECNPARFVDPDGCKLLPPAMLPHALETMWAAAGELVQTSGSVAAARVKRVDVARDFREVTSTSLYVEGLGPVKRPWARRSFTYNDPSKSNAQTLFVGSNAGGVRLYDQHEAYAEKGAPEGSLRFEIEARKGWLDKVGVRFAEHLDAVACDRLAEQRWEWSRMGMQVTGPVNAVQLLQREVQAGEVSQTVADRLLGSMVRRSFGVGGSDRVTDWRHRDLIERLGMTAGALWSNDLSRQACGRLDFETGTEVLSLSGGGE